MKPKGKKPAAKKAAPPKMTAPKTAAKVTAPKSVKAKPDPKKIMVTKPGQPQSTMGMLGGPPMAPPMNTPQMAPGGELNSVGKSRPKTF